MKKKVAAGVAVSLLLASTAAHVAFEPTELVHSAEYLRNHTQTVQIARADGKVVLYNYDTYEQMSLSDAIRAWFIRLPVAVKATILLPLWCLGALPVAIGTMLAPFWAQILGFVAQMGVLAGVFCLVYKLLFPHKKIRDLFKKKNLKWLILGAFTVTGTNVLLGQLWVGWPILRLALVIGVGFGVLCLLWKRLCGKFKAPEPDVVKTQLVLEY